jgi:hypothetical protein
MRDRKCFLYTVYSLDGFLRVYSEAVSAYNICAGDWSLKISNVMLEDEGEYQCQVITTHQEKHPALIMNIKLCEVQKKGLSFFVLKEVGRSFHNYGSTVHILCPLHCG